MHTSDFALVEQLHADRTARLVRQHRRLRFPALTVPLRFGRRERQRLAVRPVTSC